jgi:hypothetical protein
MRFLIVLILTLFVVNVTRAAEFKDMKAKELQSEVLAEFASTMTKIAVNSPSFTVNSDFIKVEESEGQTENNMIRQMIRWRADYQATEIDRDEYGASLLKPDFEAIKRGFCSELEDTLTRDVDGALVNTCDQFLNDYKASIISFAGAINRAGSLVFYGVNINRAATYGEPWNGQGWIVYDKNTSEAFYVLAVNSL